MTARRRSRIVGSALGGGGGPPAFIAGGAHVVAMAAHVGEDRGLVLEVAGAGDLVGAAEHRRVLGPQHLLDVDRGPDVELAFLALGVGVLGRVQPARGALHLALEPGHGLLDHLPVARLAGHGEGVAVDRQQLAVVVQHLLEVRHAPLAIDGVAREAAAQVIVDAAGGHALALQQERLARRGAERQAPGPPQEIVARRRRELGSGAEAALVRVAHLRQGPPGADQQGLVERDPGRPAVTGAAVGQRLLGRAPGVLVEVAEPLEHRAGVVPDLLALVAPDSRHGLEHPREPRPAVLVLGRKVGAQVERRALGIAERAERPAAALAGHVDRVHVDRVDVGALLAVDLHVHEQRVHQRGDLRVLERLVRHHVAPVARRIADRHEHRLVLGPGPLERLRPPRVPVDRVVHVLAQVR